MLFVVQGVEQCLTGKANEQSPPVSAVAPPMLQKSGLTGRFNQLEREPAVSVDQRRSKSSKIQVLLILKKNKSIDGYCRSVRMGPSLTKIEAVRRLY